MNACEVGLLTRNIKTSKASTDAEQSFYGGHVMAMVGSKMFSSKCVEFNRMGQNLTLARYPIHWHLIGDAQGQYIKNSALHDTYNRCVTVHGTNFLHVENNVTYNTVGHCFFLEDGIEPPAMNSSKTWQSRPSVIRRHWTACPRISPPTERETPAMRIVRPAYREMSFHSKNVLLPSDNTVASFWITKPGQ